MSDRPKHRKILYIVVLPVVGCLLLMLAVAWVLGAKQREWEQLKADWEAKGESFDPDDFANEIDCEPEENAWLHPLAIAARNSGGNVADKVATIDGYEWYMGVEFDRGPYLVGGLVVAEWGDHEKISERSVNEIAREYLDRFEASGEAFEEFESLVELPYWKSEEGCDAGNSGRIEELYGVSEVLAKRAALRLKVGDPDGAWADLMRAHRVSRWIEQNARGSVYWAIFWTQNETQISSIATDGCLTGSWSDEQLRRLIGGELVADGMSSREVWLAGSRGEVAYQIHHMSDRFAFFRVPQSYDFVKPYVAIRIAEGQLAPLVAYEGMGERAPLSDLADAYDVAHKRATSALFWECLKSWTSRGEMLAGISPARFVWRQLKGEVLRLSVPVVAAAELYRREHGVWPVSLTDLVPEYLPTVPNDPVDGAPLRYVVPADGVPVLYSIGENRTDDGGGEGDWFVRLAR